MSYFGMLKLSMTEMLMSLKQLLFTIVIITTGIVLTAFSLYYYQISEFEQRVCDETLSFGNAGSGYVDVLEFSDEEILKYYEDVKAIKGISNVGFFYVNDRSCITDIYRIQTKNCMLTRGIDTFLKAKGHAEVMVNYSLVNICDIKLQEGVSIESPPNKYTIHMYLGSDIAEVPIGTKYYQKEYFKNEDGEMIEKEVTYIVKGYMEKGQKWVAEDIYHTEIESDYYYDMDYGVLNVKSDEYITPSSHMFFSISDENEWDRIRKEICDSADKYETDILVGKLDVVFDKVVKNKEIENKYLFQLAIVVMISVVFIQLCVQSSRVINNKTKYGIFFSNGVLPENVIGMLFLENMFKWFISLMLSGVISFWFLYNQYALFPEYLTRMTSNIKSFVLWPTIGISAGVMILGMIFPVIIIGRMAPSKLIKELGD